MAAFIAKKTATERVILLSGPVDFIGENRTLAPWISADSVTPPNRWFALYHAREMRADLLAQSYETLHIPPAHIRVLDGKTAPLPEGHASPDPYHVSVIVGPQYASDWRFLIGSPP